MLEFAATSSLLLAFRELAAASRAAGFGILKTQSLHRAANYFLKSGFSWYSMSFRKHHEMYFQLLLCGGKPRAVQTPGEE